MGESTSGERTIFKIGLVDKEKYARLASGDAGLIEAVGVMGFSNETAWEGRGEDIRSEE